MKAYILPMFLVATFISVTGSGKETTSDTVLPYFSKKDLTPVWPHNSGSGGDFLKAEPVKLLNQNGKTFSEKNFLGRVSVISFFFTQCAGICPMLTTKLKRLQKEFREEKAFQITSFSVTPAPDTPRVLKKWADKNNTDPEKWILLTGDMDEIYRFASGSLMATGAVSEDGATGFTHTENFYLLDQKGMLRGIYNGNGALSVKRLIEDAGMLLKTDKKRDGHKTMHTKVNA